MRKPRHACRALLLALAAASCARAAEPPVVVEPAFLDLGSVTFGQRSEGTWTLRNRSDRPVAISRIGPSGCQCASLELELPARGTPARIITDGPPLELTLAPGEEARVHFLLDTARYREPISRKVGAIGVHLREHPYLTLQWGADIWTPFAVSPWAIELGEVGVRQRAQGRVLVSAHDDEDFGLAVDAEQDGWRLLSRRLTPEGGRALYEVAVTAPRELPEGGFQKEFLFNTTLAGAPPVRFFVQGIARPDLTISPTRLLLDPQQGRAEARVTVTHRGQGSHVLDLLVEGLAPGLSIADRDEVAAARRGFTLRWTGDSPAAAVKGVLRVHTGDREQPILELPYSVLPARAAGP
jgi:hypothetical protein